MTDQRAFPVVGVVAFPLLAVLDVIGIHALDESWGVAGVAGAVAAAVGALLANVWFGDKADRSLYFGKRLLTLVVIAALVGALACFGFDLPGPTAVAAGVSGALVAGIALMVAMGDL